MIHLAIFIHGSGPPPKGFPYIVILAFALTAPMLMYFVYYRLQRRRQLAALASELGFTQWPNSRLPPGLNLAGTPLARFSSVFNHFEGAHRGINYCFFDLAIGGGRATSYRSAIAVLSPGDPFGWDAAIPALQVLYLNGWILLIEPRAGLTWESGRNYGMMPIPRVAATLAAIRAHIDHTQGAA